MSNTTDRLTVFLPSRHAMHRPSKDYSDGLPPFDHLETPQRIDELLKGIQSARAIELIETTDLALDAAYQLHDKDYVDFLLAIDKTIKYNHEYIPSYFGKDMSKTPLKCQGGMYCRETGTPIGSGTIKAALNSAAAAKLAAEYITTTHTSCFALCRPPGHHAGKRRYGGYCYFNNAYIAASVISRHGKCAVLDVDYHLGDGSMEFATEKTPYFSLNANPYTNYPHLDASVPLPTEHVELVSFAPNIKGKEYLELLTNTCQKIAKLKPDYLILSLGFDTLGSDSIQDERIYLVPEDFGRMAKIVGSLGVPVLVLTEGGYDLPSLYDCARAFAQHI